MKRARGRSTSISRWATCARRTPGTAAASTWSCRATTPCRTCSPTTTCCWHSGRCLACLRAGGGCIISVRDYALEARGKNLVKPYGVRTENGKRYLLFQVWDFEGEHYDLSFFFIEEDLSTLEVKTHAMRSKYYAVSTDKLGELMREAGFQDVKRVDGAFYQPLVVGTKATEQSRVPKNRSEK